MARTRLAIVGASVRAAAQSALRAGFDVVGADLFADSDLDGLCPVTKIPGAEYPDALADWLAEQSVDAWMYTGALENHPDLVDRMAAIAPLWGVSGEALRRCRDPLVVQGVLAGYGVRFAETRLPFLRALESEDWLFKTYRHSGGAGIRELHASEDRAVLNGQGFAQRFVVGAPCSVVFALSDTSAAALGVCRQRIGTHDNSWAFAGASGPVVHGAGVAVMLARLGAALLQGLSLRGIVGVDFVVDTERDSEATVVEINPRFTASVEVHERVRRRSAAAELTAAFHGLAIDHWVGRIKQRVAKRFLFATESVRIDEAFAAWMTTHDCADRPRVGERIEAGRPVCTLFAEGDSVDTAEANAELLAAEALGVLSECRVD